MWLLEENQLGSSLTSDQGQHDQLDPFYAQFRDRSRFWIQRVAVPMIMVVGLFGNLITVIIMTRRRMRSTTNMYLAALALVDMLYLVLTFLLGLSHYPNMAGREYYLYWRLRPFLMMLTDACSNTSVWLTVTFTIERFIAVKYPMKGKVWCTEARAKRLIVFVFLFGIMFASPVPFEWEVVEKSVRKEQTKQLAPANVSHFASELQTDGNSFTKSQSIYGDKLDDEISTFINNKDDAQRQYQSSQQRPKMDEIAYILTLENSDFGRNETYKTIYYWSTAVIFYFIPLLSLTFFNGFLILSVHRSLRERNRMTTGQQSVSGCGGGARNQIYCQNQSKEARAKKEQLQERDRRLVIPRIAIGSRELDGTLDKSCIGENGRVELRTNGRGDLCQATTTEEGEEVEQHQEQDVFNSESDSCQLKLISRSDLVISSADKMTTPRFESDSPVGTNVANQHETTPTSSVATSSGNSSRVYVERKVEFNCDSDKADDESLNVQTNSDNGNNDLNGIRASRPNCNGASGSKFSFAVLKTNHNNAKPTNKTHPLANVPSPTDQFVVPSDDVVINKDRPDQDAELDGCTDNKHVSTVTSGSLDDVNHFVSMSNITTGNATLTDDKTAVINISKHANSKTCHHSANLQSNNSYGSEKFQLKNATASGAGPASLSQCNYDSGSCTTIQTATSLVPISTQERRITIMLIAVVILFLCCQIPSAAMLLYTSVREPTPNTNEHALVLAFGNIFNFLMAVNAAGNFILYSFLSKKYRRTFMILFCNCFQRKNSDPEEKLRTTRFCSSQYSSSHQASAPGGSMDENRSKRSIGYLKRWSNVGFLRPKLGSTHQLTLQSDDLGNHLVKGSFAKHERRDTLV